MAAIEIITTQYEFSHGRKPRGRGFWAFAPVRNPEAGNIIWTGQMTYADAKKHVATIARERGITTLHVLP